MSKFYIASLKHTHKSHEHIVFWQRFEKGYTPVLGEYVGRYCFGEACDLNDGLDCLAVPAHVVDSLAVTEPYYQPGRRFYDQRGPVVDNTKAMWKKMIAASIKEGRYERVITPETFRGKRRSFSFSPVSPV